MPDVQRVDEDAIVNLPVDPPEVDTLPAAAEPTGPAPTSSTTMPGMPDTGPLADVQRRKMEATRAVQERTSARMERDRQRAEQAFQATGIQPGELPAWDAQQQAARYRTEPLDAFGSLGSVFGMIASAFTRAPMQNALNASAAAMNAIRAGDEQNFQRAWDAWKANTDLTIKRHNLENQHYQNALSMMTTNMNAGRAEMEMLATRFGDERALFLLQNGLDNDLNNMVRGRADAVDHMRTANEHLSQDAVRAQLWDQESRAISESDAPPAEQAGRKLAAWNRIYGARQPTVSQEAFGLLLHQMGPNAKAEDVIKRAQDLGLLQRAPVLTQGRLDAAEVIRRREEIKKELIAQGIDSAEAETQAHDQAVREVRQGSATPTGNQLVQLRERNNQYGHALEKIDSVINTVNNYVGSTGLVGRARRLEERISNLAGSGRSDMVQAMRDIQFLRLIGPQLLLDRNGRPLAAEQGLVHDIIAGLERGDTNTNTLRAMEELKKILAAKRKELQDILNPANSTTRPQPSAPPSATGNWWQQVPDAVRP